MSSGETTFDTVIIGGGPGGMAAALWCADLEIDAVLIERETEFGGQLLRTYNPITNYPGVDAPNGRHLSDLFNAQIERTPSIKRLGEEVVSLENGGRTVVMADGARLTAKSIIIATGTRRRVLNVAGETEFRGRGVLDSGTKEKAFAAGKNAVVVGGGDAAFENALILAEVAARVLLIHRSDRFTARREFVERVLEHHLITVLENSVVSGIFGGDLVERVSIKDLVSGETLDYRTDAIVVRIGVEPNSGFVRKTLDTDPQGYILIDSSCETSLADVFAVGDVASPLAPTISGAAGQAATAAKVIASRIRRANIDQVKA
jgi:thioredoxin reductase (NADPH)